MRLANFQAFCPVINRKELRSELTNLGIRAILEKIVEPPIPPSSPSSPRSDDAENDVKDDSPSQKETFSSSASRVPHRLPLENKSSLQSFSLRLFKQRFSSILSSSRGIRASPNSLSNFRQRALLHYQQAFRSTTSGLTFCENALKNLFEPGKNPPATKVVPR